ncbi:short-chain dehydrogenase [Mycobacterium sp. 852013-50091_SCH5140682]|uniref:SDR family oxidoreductase n=1 Tax=Mycobacterium sp. 852013-50091_SCH5140682 TaxID=1834109 RepID=UPI0007E96EFE|nr:SDR family oxidoreductase [Mycobacterium sp. 852013-50091_SCH5140682]OBC15798.1 short-chain dehydrogenase [Mycobacterium sp. 852013-50091_SCH5140682]
MSHQIKGSTAVVTGGQRGLGKAIVDELLARGATKVYATSRSPEPSADPRVVVVQAEVTDADSVARLAELASDATIVVNNAGVLGGRSLLQSDFDEIRSVLETNYFGALRVTRAFAPQLAGGTLVNIASVLSWLPGSGAYGVSKAALWSANNSLRLELQGQDTDVVGVYLGYTDTSMVADLDVPKNDPADVARQIVDGIESGADEVLADELTRRARVGAFA